MDTYQSIMDNTNVFCYFIIISNVHIVISCTSFTVLRDFKIISCAFIIYLTFNNLLIIHIFISWTNSIVSSDFIMILGKRNIMLCIHTIISSADIIFCYSVLLHSYDGSVCLSRLISCVSYILFYHFDVLS